MDVNDVCKWICAWKSHLQFCLSGWKFVCALKIVSVTIAYTAFWVCLCKCVCAIYVKLLSLESALSCYTQTLPVSLSLIPLGLVDQMSRREVGELFMSCGWKACHCSCLVCGCCFGYVLASTSVLASIKSPGWCWTCELSASALWLFVLFCLWKTWWKRLCIITVLFCFSVTMLK